MKPSARRDRHGRAGPFAPRWLGWRFTARLTGASWLSATVIAAQAGVLSHELERAMARRSSQADTAVIVRFADPGTGTVTAQPPSDRSARDNRLLVALQARSSRNRASLEPFLAAQGADRVKDLWIINGLAATMPASAVRQLADLPGIERVDLDSFVQGGRSQRIPPSRMRRDSDAREPARADDVPTVPPSRVAATPGARAAWNISAVHAPELWAKGFTGQGVVVAEMDTGVDLAHPDLHDKYRGGTHSWFDPHGEEATPYDALGHGTQAMGVMLGGSAIGVAPGARWIATRLFNSDGRASMSDIHRAFQWLLDPDSDPSTVDSPDVVNASWTLTGPGSGICLMEFSSDIRALRDAGIAVVFAAGNDGPSAGTSSSPGNNPGVLSVGAVDSDLEIARQTSRGPSSCDGAPFPRLLAPGVNVRTADLSHGGAPSYTSTSGTSLAAPHVAGVLALLMSAFPSVPAAEVEFALVRGGKEVGKAGTDAGPGPPLVDALAAFNILHETRASVIADAARK